MMKLIAVVLIAFSQFAFEDAFEIKPRIVNGQNAGRQFPFYVYLNLTSPDGSRASCGGTLLNDEFVITAAHCLATIESIDVYLGTTNIDNPRQVIHVKKQNFFVNPIFFMYFIWNDIGLIKLPQKVEFTRRIQPVRLPTTCEIAENMSVTAMGNGITGIDGKISRKLQFTQLKTIPMISCRQRFKIILLRKSVICVKDLDNEGTTSASAVWLGDSGSPLVTDDGTLVGLTSFGQPDGWRADAPQVFTKIVSYSYWINKITGLALPKC